MEKADILKQKVEEAGLAVCQAGNWHGTPYCWADYNFEIAGVSKTTAKYLFTFTDAEGWNSLFSSYKEFVFSIIIPLYFEQSGDISWNLYWVSVLEQSQLDRIDTQKKILFSGNTEYTRNLFAPLEHLRDFIPVGRVPSVPADENIPMPGEDWARQLEPLGMSFCLDEYSSEALDTYAQSVPIESREASEGVSMTDGEQQISCLRSISIPKSFRPHYYHKDLSVPFAPVNLLFGANGSGKTSVLSAIELGMTGEVRVTPSASLTYPGTDIVISADTNGAPVRLHPPRKAAEMKRLERQWYKNRNTNRPGVQLNSLFHRFNYLSVEETFIFASQQPDLSDAFSKILYGPETVEMWRNRGRYLDECSRMANLCEQEASQCASKLEDMDRIPTAGMAALRAYLSASNFNFVRGETANSILQQVQIILAEYDKVSGLGPVISRANARGKLGSLIVSRKAYGDEVNRIESEIEKNRGLRRQLQTEASNLAFERNRKAALSRQLERALNMFSFYCANRESIENYRDLSAQIPCIELSVKRLRSLIDDCGPALKAPPERHASEIHEEMKQLQEKHSRLRQRRDELAEQISTLELAGEQHSQLLAELHAKGLELYRLDKGRCTCPLCGAQGVTGEKLKRHILSETSQGSAELTSLYHASEEVENELKAVGSRLKLLDPLHLAALEYGNAVDALRQSFPGLGSYDDLCAEYERASSELNSRRAEISRLESGLTVALTEKISSCNSLQSVLDSRRELLKLLESNDFSLPEKACDKELLHSASEIWHDLENEQQEINARLTETHVRMEEQKILLDTYAEQQKAARDALARETDELERANQVSLFWDKVTAFCAVPDMNGESLLSVCERIVSLARDVVESEKRDTERARLKKAEQLARDKEKRCLTLKSALEGLRPPDEYADDFIKQNVAQVSRIFLALHSPQEFSRLGMSDNELMAYRGSEAVPVSQMSTGQRAALVIAVFFQMNFASPHAPNFLLMDEPVANIDDLNVLAMLDFLREMIICRGKQLFFTTANRNIAKLFRRKFSFMGQGFQELDFLRENEQSLTIKQLFFDQHSEVSANSL